MRTWARRAIAVAVLVGVAGVAAAEARSRAPRPGVAALEREVFALVNRHRRARGLPALVQDARIARQARLHSQAMAARARPFGHAGYERRMAALRRAGACGGNAENVAMSRGRRAPAAGAVRDWLASRGHRRNIEGPYETTGIGVAATRAGELYFTQIFFGRCRAPRARPAPPVPD